MWSDKSSSESTRIGRYWDNLVTGGSAYPESATGDIDPALVQTIFWLERVDDAQSASPEFSRRFEAQFLQAIGADPTRIAPHLARPAGTLSTFPVQRGFTQENHAKTRQPTSAISRRTSVGRYTQLGGARWKLVAAAVLLLVVSMMGQRYVAQRNEDATDTNVILAPSSTEDVPMDRGNAERSGIMPGPGIADDLTVRWSFEVGHDGISAPVVAGDTIFVTSWLDPIGVALDQGSVIAIDATSGSERWQFPTEHATSTTPAVSGEIVFVGDTGGIVYALDARTGEERWRKALQGKWTSEPVLVGDTVIIASANAKAPLHVAAQEGTIVVGSGFVGQAADGFQLYAFDRRTGVERWQSGDNRSGQPGLFAFDAERGAPLWQFAMASFESGPAIANGRVFAGSSLDSAMHALDLSSGAEVWRTPITEDLPLNSSPAVAGGRVFVATTSGLVLSLDETSGEALWQASAEHATLTGSPVVVGSTVYVVDTEFGVSAFSATDGSELWSEQLDLTGQVVVSPVIVNGHLYIGTSLEANTAYAAMLWAFTGSDER